MRKNEREEREEEREVEREGKREETVHCLMVGNLIKMSLTSIMLT